MRRRLIMMTEALCCGASAVGVPAAASAAPPLGIHKTILSAARPLGIHKTIL